MTAASASGAATVIAGFGRQLLVRTDAGESMTAVTRGRKYGIVVGDRVRVAALGSGQAVVESVGERRNEFKRSDAMRTKLIAANVDQAAIVIAPRPGYSEELLLRVTIAARAEGVPIALIVNKSDLGDERAAIEPRVACYRALGFPVFDCSARTDPEGTRAALMPWLAQRTTLLLGESGMGKSTLVNLLVPEAGLRTREISEALGAGKHTTTFTRMFALPGDAGWIVDSPGFQAFGLAHLSQSQRAHAMPEYEALLGKCRFYNCTHREEPGCAIRAAVKAGTVDARRYQTFARLVDEGVASDRASLRS